MRRADTLSLILIFDRMMPEAKPHGKSGAMAGRPSSLGRAPAEFHGFTKKGWSYRLWSKDAKIAASRLPSSTSFTGEP